MILSDYARSIIQDPQFQTKSDVRLDVGLQSRLRMIIEASEQEIREWGAALRWSNTLNRLVLDGGFRGDRTSVGWEGKVGGPDYIGTIHTHPYRRKLSPEAAVGFSIGDFVFYAEQYPLNFPAGINLVLSNDKVFYAIYREATRKQIGDEEKHALETDENESEAHVMAHFGQQQGQMRLLDMQGEVMLADVAGRIDDSAEIESGFYSQIPGYTQVRMESNDRMIRRAARALRVELYIGTIHGVAHLKSDRVYFASGFKGWQQRKFG